MNDENPNAVEGTPSDTKSLAHYKAELEAYKRHFEQWTKDVRRICNRYAQEKQVAPGQPITKSDFNVLWSNTETIKPALFSAEPVPVVERRHRDPDPVGRVASEMLTRALMVEIEQDGWYDVFNRVTLDNLLTGRGVPWVRYEADFAGEGEEEQVAREMTPIDHVSWSDFAHSLHQSWAEVMKRGWVARKTMMTRKEVVERFGEQFGDIPTTHMLPGMDKDAPESDATMNVIGTAEIWELWDSVRKKVVWFCCDYPKELDERDDPYGLEGFFPCPKPAYSALPAIGLIPIPDYLQYEKLAMELDTITDRIARITKAIRVRGAYDVTIEGLGQLLVDDGEVNKLIAVNGMADLRGAGSTGSRLDNVVQFLPIDMFAQVLAGLYDARDRTKQTLFEVSGLSDIMRGTVDPNEKLGQSRLKSQFGSQRLEQKRNSINFAIRDALRIKAELMAEQYSPETLRQVSGFDFMQEVERIRREAEQQQPGLGEMAVQQMFEAAIRLLKDEKTRGFRIEVEEGSTIASDMEEEQTRRIEFLQAAGGFLQQALPVAQQVPEAGPLMGEMLLFGVRGFKTARSLESAFESAVRDMNDQVQSGNTPPPQDPNAPQGEDPEVQRAKGQLEVQDMQQASAANQQKMQIDLQQRVLDLQQAQIEAQTKQMEAELKVQEMALKYETDMAEAQAKMAQADAKIREAKAKPLETAAQQKE